MQGEGGPPGRWATLFGKDSGRLQQARGLQNACERSARLRLTGRDAVDSDRVVLDRRVTSLGEIQLQQRQTPDGGLALEIILNGVFLMASYNQASEHCLAELALRMGGSGRRVLIGGLGMGHTLQAVLECEGVSWVDVVEMEEAVIDWQRLYRPEAAVCLDDPRVHLVIADFRDFVAGARSQYDAICLDVDNGPGWLSVESNRPIYHLAGLRRLRELLVDGGMLTVWSAAPAPRFAARLGRVFGNAAAVLVPESDPWGREKVALIYRATKQPPDDSWATVPSYCSPDVVTDQVSRHSTAAPGASTRSSSGKKVRLAPPHISK
jgi:hypothetical protein